MEDKNYVEYTFYDESGEYIAIIKENTPKYVIDKLINEYDQVKYEE